MMQTNIHIDIILFTVVLPRNPTNHVDVILYYIYMIIVNSCISTWSLWDSLRESCVYSIIYTASEKPVNDQSYGVLDRYGITILYK